MPVKWITKRFRYGRQCWECATNPKKKINPQLTRHRIKTCTKRISSSFNSVSKRSEKEWRWDDPYITDYQLLDYHAGRVRWLIEHPKFLNVPIRLNELVVEDGNHRLTALVYLKEKNARVISFDYYLLRQFERENFPLLRDSGTKSS